MWIVVRLGRARYVARVRSGRPGPGVPGSIGKPTFSLDGRPFQDDFRMVQGCRRWTGPVELGATRVASGERARRTSSRWKSPFADGSAGLRRGRSNREKAGSRRSGLVVGAVPLAGLAQATVLCPVRPGGGDAGHRYVARRPGSRSASQSDIKTSTTSATKAAAFTASSRKLPALPIMRRSLRSRSSTRTSSIAPPVESESMRRISLRNGPVAARTCGLTRGADARIVPEK